MPGLALAFLVPAMARYDVVVPSTDSHIIYNPPLCTSASILAGCISPWQTSNDTVPGTTIVYTNGPIPQAGNVIPQMFFNFRASALYLRTTIFSNATVNLSLTAEPTDVSITTQLNTSMTFIVAVNIPETQVTTLGVTFLPEGVPTRFDIESITLTVMNASASSSFMPSASLPVSSFAPTFVSSTTAPSTSTSGANNNKATIPGAMLGALGILGVFLLYW